MSSPEPTWITYPFLGISEQQVSDLLISSLREEIHKAGFRKGIIGVSGGIDSALALYIAVQALGKENVMAIRMPYRTSSKRSLENAQQVIELTGVESLTVDISSQIDAYYEQQTEATPLRRGNKMARERMSILYDLSAAYAALVIGTSNRTELLLGYGTQFGDTACAVNPLGDLYKTQVYQLATYLGVPESILTSVPSADLWENQTDEAELGFSYRELDCLLHYMVDQLYTTDQLKSLSFSPDLIQAAQQRVVKNQYKRMMPVVIKVGRRTVGVDFRYPRDIGL